MHLWTVSQPILLRVCRWLNASNVHPRESHAVRIPPLVVQMNFFPCLYANSRFSPSHPLPLPFLCLSWFAHQHQHGWTAAIVPSPCFTGIFFFLNSISPLSPLPHTPIPSLPAHSHQLPCFSHLSQAAADSRSPQYPAVEQTTPLAGCFASVLAQQPSEKADPIFCCLSSHRHFQCVTFMRFVTCGPSNHYAESLLRNNWMTFSLRRKCARTTVTVPRAWHLEPLC